MIELDPTDKQELAIALVIAVKRSGLSLSEIRERLDQTYGVKISNSGLSHLINRGTIGLQRALQILAICEQRELIIKE